MGCTDCTRVACIDLKAFPLQLLLRRERAWRDKPAVVVVEDKPNAKILWLNEHARAHGILPGMRYAAGLALCADLCAGTVDDAEIERAVKAITERLRHFGPDVEPHAGYLGPGEDGVFWVGAAGLERLGIHRSSRKWAEGIDAALWRLGLAASIVVGFSRFATYALARSLREPMVWVLRDAAEEHASRLRVPLSRLHIDPKTRDDLHALGVETVGDLLKLPADGLQERFGDAVYKLHLEARGEQEVPIQRAEEEIPLRETMILDDAEKDVSRLLFGIKRMLDPLLARLADRRFALAALTLELKVEGRKGRVEKLKPATPTLDAQQILDLLLLRLESLQLKSRQLGAGVIELALQAEGVAATREQLELFVDKPKRDPDAIRRAFARLRAEFGANAVVRASLREGHLPEAAYEWKPIGELPLPKPRLCRRTLVRRLRTHAWALPHRPRHEEDGWQLRGRDDTAVHDLRGPYVVSGGWWRAEDAETAREYYFAGTRKGEWLWVYRDKRRRRWFLQGRVE
jgi:protein ImuB